MEVNLKELATKADLEQTRLALRSEIREAESRLEADLKGEIAEVRQDLAAQKADIAWLKWLTGAIAGGILLQLLKSFGVI